MGLRVNTNIASINAQRNTSIVTNRLARDYQRLSTGLRIATAADDAAGLAISERLRSQVRSLGQANHLILRNHGLLAAGPDIPTAFNRLWTLQRACEIQLASDAGRGPNRAIPAEILETVPATRVAGRGPVNRLVFEAMLRRAGISRAMFG